MAKVVNVFGTPFDDDLVLPNKQQVRAWGLGGDDKIVGNKGNDFIDGGLGNDVLRGEDGNDRIHGNHGNDRIEGGRGNDFVGGGVGDDIVGGGKGNDRVYDGYGNDRVEGGEGNDRIFIGAGSLEYVWAGTVGGTNDGVDHIYFNQIEELAVQSQNKTIRLMDYANPHANGGEGATFVHWLAGTTFLDSRTATFTTSNGITVVVISEGDTFV